MDSLSIRMQVKEAFQQHTSVGHLLSVSYHNKLFISLHIGTTYLPVCRLPICVKTGLVNTRFDV